MFQEEVMVPMGKWAEKRLAKLAMNDLVRDESRSQSGFGPLRRNRPPHSPR